MVTVIAETGTIKRKELLGEKEAFDVVGHYLCLPGVWLLLS